MTDQEVIEYIKSQLTDYDKAFGSHENLIGFWVKETPELEAWAKAVIEANTGKKFTKKFLDDLPEIDDPLAQEFPEVEVGPDETEEEK